MVLTYVGIGYGSHVIAADISLSLPKGTLNCIIGRNGCGKSTLLRTIALLQKPLSGKITFGGRDIAAMDKKQLSQTIGIVLTERVEAHGLTVRELVGLGRTPFTGFFGSLSSKDKEAVRRAMELTGILPLAERIVDTLSDGEYQKAIISKTLAQETPVILMDEPTAFLDYAGKVDLILAIRRLCLEEGKTVLMSTHDVNPAMHLADNIFLMADGKIRHSRQQADVRRFIGERAAGFL